MESGDNTSKLSALLTKLREINPSVGEYVVHAPSRNNDLHVKLSNGKLIVPAALFNDFAIHEQFATAAQLRACAHSFQPDDAKGMSIRVGNLKFLATLGIACGIILVIIFGILAFNNYKERKAKEYVRSHIRGFVTASGSNYEYSSLGGIYNFSVTVNNTTEYNIDNVFVRVRYIKSNGETWKEEQLDFNYLAPRETRTIRAPDSDRGTKIDFQIMQITSRDLALY